MIIIYDFDGTLTPYSLPQYPVIKQCGYTDKKLMDRVEKEILKGNAPEFYSAYWYTYMNILAENGIAITRDNVCLGAKGTKLNDGVEDYFRRFNSEITGIKHYIVTSGAKDYIDETVISDLVDGTYGVTFKEENGMFKEVDILLSDKKKVDIIKEIRSENADTKEIIYFGDGLTDKCAFEYVHSIGGENVFIGSNERSQTNYQKLNENGIINYYFDADFRPNSAISNYIQSQMELSIDDDPRDI